MQMQQIRYFLALCEERNFTRAARRCGVSQPSLTNAMIALERELGGALFQRRPEIVLTVLGHAVHPYLQRIAENADHARDAAQTLANVRPANREAAPLEQDARAAPRRRGFSRALYKSSERGQNCLPLVTAGCLTPFVPVFDWPRRQSDLAEPRPSHEPEDRDPAG